MKASVLQYNFNAGEWSPATYGRVDMEKYRNSLTLCQNWIPQVQGGLARRPGTRYVAAVKNPAHTTVLLPFQFSTTQAYAIEAGDQYFRYYANRAPLMSGGSPVETSTPYAHTALRTLKFAQSNDVLYLAHNSYKPRTLTRTTTTSFALAEYAPKWGPFLTENDSAVTITASARTGAITLTASAAVFEAGHVGAQFLFRTPIQSKYQKWQAGVAYASGSGVYYLNRVYIATSTATSGVNPPVHDSGNESDGGVSWDFESIDRGYCIISGVTNSTTATANVVESLPAETLTGSTRWSEGAWSDVRGYPSAVVFSDDRLWWAGTPHQPQTVWSSRVSDYVNFMDIDPATGDINADGALTLTLNANDVNAIYWLADEERALLIGTAGGEWILRPATASEPLSATNVSAKRSTAHGSANVQAVRADRTTLFVQRGKEKIRELAYVYEIDGFRAPDMTILADHVTQGGVEQIVLQKSPMQILWAVRTDGVLAGMTYERDQDVVGWHRHTFGGGGLARSVACIPEPAGVYDDAWVVVERVIGGNTVKWVEYITDMRARRIAIEDSHYVDAGHVYEGTATASIAGATWLAGQTVAVLADGATHPDVTVAGDGTVTLTRAASRVHIGFPYNSDAMTMRVEAGAADGTAQGKTKRIHRVVLRLLTSLGIQVGASFTSLYRPPIRRSSDAMGVAVPPFTGDLEVQGFDADYGLDGLVCLRADQPLPCTVLALIVQLNTQDR